MFVLGDILGTRDLTAIIVIAVVILVVVVFGRRISISVRGVTASVENAASKAERAAEIAAAKAEEVAAKLDAAHADLKNSVGEPNGNGDLMRMVSRVLAEQSELFALLNSVRSWQTEHEQLDESRIGDVLNRIVELSQYSHDGVHAMRNLLTPLKGQVDLMWAEYIAAHPIPTEEP